MMTGLLKTPHPGEILQEEFLTPLGLSQGYWLHLQNTYDIMEVTRDRYADIKSIKPYVTPAEITVC